MATARGYHHGDLRRSLIEASLALISEKGTRDLNLREVARRAGVSHSASYRHFENKEELLAAVSEQGFNRLRTFCEKAIAKEQDAVVRLRLAGEAYVEFALKHPGEFQVMFSLAIDEKVHPSAALAAESTFALLADLVGACKVRWDTVTSTRIAWAQVHGIAELALRQQFRIPLQRDIKGLAKKAIEALLHGLIVEN